jgi:hypothetical protein
MNLKEMVDAYGLIAKKSEYAPEDDLEELFQSGEAYEPFKGIVKSADIDKMQHCGHCIKHVSEADLDFVGDVSSLGQLIFCSKECWAKCRRQYDSQGPVDYVHTRAVSITLTFYKG